MNAREMLERSRGAARWAVAWRWTPVLGVALAAVWLVCKLDAGRSAAGEAARLAEAEALRAKGQIVTVIDSRAAIAGKVKRLEAESVDLRAALAVARRAAPGARPTLVVRASTGGVAAGGTPRDAGRPPNPAGGRGPGAKTESLTGAGPACLLAAGDRGEVRVDQVLLETRAGNLVFVGAASAFRVSPAPETRLFGGQLRAEVAAQKPPGAPGWGAGAFVGVGRGGWAAGPAFAAPPARLGPLRLELVAGAGLGANGVWTGGATGIARW
jgi:hypothetical protein